MSYSKRVSVCVPTYCGAATLGATIESVLSQKFSDLELIVIDDGSPDETRVVVSKYSDPRLRYIRNDVNLGPEGNWNRCLEEAKGKYFKLLPHDDVLHPDCLGKQVEVLDKDIRSAIAFVFCARNVVDINGQHLMTRAFPRRRVGIISAPDAVKQCLWRGTNLFGEPGAVLFRRSDIERTGKFDGSYPYVIDLDYWFRLLELGDAYYLDEPLATFRVTDKQWSVRIGRSQGTDFMRLVEKVRPSTRFDINRLDRSIAGLSARMNTLARLCFYAIHFRS